MSNSATAWTVAHKAPRPMGFSRQGYWGGLPFPFSRGSSPPRDQAQVSHIAGRRFTIWATREASYSGGQLLHYEQQPCPSISWSPLLLLQTPMPLRITNCGVETDSAQCCFSPVIHFRGETLPRGEPVKRNDTKCVMAPVVLCPGAQHISLF